MDEIAAYARSKQRKYQREYHQRPEVKKHYSDYMREYNSRPENIERRREYQRRRQLESKLAKYIDFLQAHGYTITPPQEDKKHE